ncbi:MAG TPA: CDP-alcohol phosphatidyltransferase family protein [Longimicrobiales bacterium]|nr:CDP-alcohol phosphatidyltransferase family protein [Longimicrobiales bacterium]
MATVEQHSGGRARSARGARGVLPDLGVGLALALGAVAATWWLVGLPASYVLIGLSLYLSLAGLILRTFPNDTPGPGMGPANRVTLARAALAMPVFALTVQPGALGTAGRWWVIALSTGVMILDGVDGRVARRTGSQTRFGARFDMELDAALIMALSLIVWRSGKVGAWVLLIGLIRYAFVAAGWIWPALGRELPPSLRRRVVCVIQGVVLLAALGPIVPVGTAVVVTAAGLAALGYSFAVDVRWALSEGA